MQRLARSRGFWAGVSVPVALVAAFLIYGSVHGAAVRAGGVPVPTGDAIATAAAASITALNATPTVVLPSSLNSAVAGINDAPGPDVASSLAPGGVSASHAHLLLSDVGSAGNSVYAASTDKGRVCIFETDGPAGCVNRFDSSMPIAWMGGWQNGSISSLAGLVPDDVVGVALEEGSKTQQATLGNNAFYVEPSADPSAIIVTYEDGSTQSLALPSAHEKLALDSASSEAQSTPNR